MTTDTIDILKRDADALRREVLAAKPGAFERGKAMTCPNPGHPDANPSAGVFIGDDGAARVKCHACGWAGDIFDVRAESTGKPLADVLREARNNGHAPKRNGKSKSGGKLHLTRDDAERAAAWSVAQKHGDGWTITRHELYHDESGVVAAVVLRFDAPDGSDKTYVPIHPDGDGWRVGDPNDKWPLHGLPLLRDAKRVIVCEGEKCCEAARSIGLVATTSAHGAQSPHKSDWSALAGKDIVVWPDKDDAGARYAQDVARLATEAGAKSVRIIAPPDDLDAGGDIVDWLDARECSEPDDLRAAVEAMADAAQPWTPEAAADGKPAPDDEWPDAPIPLCDAQADPMPGDILTGSLADIVEAVARATETPRELNTAFALGALSAACAKRWSVMVKRGYFEPVNLFVCAALVSGMRKSAAMLPIIRPLVDWEIEQRANMEQDVKAAQAIADALGGKVKDIKARAVKAEGDELKKLLAEVADLERQTPEIPTVPQLFTNDITSENLATLMQANDERMAILSDEGGIFDTMAGRYNGGVHNVDVYLQSFTGAPVRVNRGSRPPVLLDHPALTICVSPQPEVLRTITANTVFRGRGLLARFAYLLPPSTLGRRTLNTTPVPDDVSARWSNDIRAILTSPMPDRPAVLRLADAAYAAWHGFALKVEHDMADGGRLSHVTDWGAKLPGLVARLAGLLHLSERAQDFGADGIDADTMARAIRFGEVLVSHALVAFDAMQVDDTTRAARAILDWLDRTKPATFTAREAWTAVRRQYQHRSDIDPALGLLVERNIARKVVTPAKRGRPSDLYALHPAQYCGAPPAIAS